MRNLYSAPLFTHVCDKGCNLRSFIIYPQGGHYSFNQVLLFSGSLGSSVKLCQLRIHTLWEPLTSIWVEHLTCLTSCIIMQYLFYFLNRIPISDFVIVNHNWKYIWDVLVINVTKIIICHNDVRKDNIKLYLKYMIYIYILQSTPQCYYYNVQMQNLCSVFYTQYVPAQWIS